MNQASRRTYTLIFVLLVLLLITSTIWYFVFIQDLKKVLSVTFLDIGQGDSIFIESPNGTQVLIDGGIDKTVLRKLAEHMSFWDHSIDMVIATHPDRDHIGGLPSVLEHFSVKTVLEPGVYADNGTYEALLANVDSRRTLLHTVQAGERYDLGSGVYLDILFPDRVVEDIDANTASIVAKVSYGNTSFLFTGDSPQAIEKYLGSLYGDSLDVDVLKLGHHGSKTSTSEEILRFTSPDYAVISAGKDNQYGHPHKEVIERLDSFGITYINTASVGTIVFESDGDSVVLK